MACNRLVHVDGPGGEELLEPDHPHETVGRPGQAAELVADDQQVGASGVVRTIGVEEQVDVALIGVPRTSEARAIPAVRVDYRRTVRRKVRLTLAPWRLRATLIR